MRIFQEQYASLPPAELHLTQPKYRQDIDGLRALAVLSVVGFHAFPFLMKGGFVGVDVFFVISGFLISSIIFRSLERNAFSFSEFYGHRIRRIFPALLLVLAVSYAFGWFILLADEYMQLGKHIAAGAGFVSNLVLWSESGYFDSAAESKPLLHLWSLGIEEQFYIVWPLLLLGAWKKRFNLLTITIAIAVISFILNINGVRQDAVATFYSPQTRFWELLAGSMLAHVSLYKISILSRLQRKLDYWIGIAVYTHAPVADGKNLRNAQSLAGVLLIVASVIGFKKHYAFPGWWAVFPVLGTVLVISAGTQAWANRVLLSNRIFVWFGLISYPLYLWHWPLLAYIRIAESETPNACIRVGAVVLAIFLAWGTYIFVEKPIRFGKQKKYASTLLVITMVVVGCVGINCFLRLGLPFRFPKIIQELTQYKYDLKSAWRENTCFLMEEQSYPAFAACKPYPAGAREKRLLLWGDSYAAHLYPGLKDSFSDDYTIDQRSASSCPPIIGMDFEKRKHCRDINSSLLADIQESKKTDLVILAAAWDFYDWAKVEATISELKKIGIRDIVLVGPLPRWKDSLPKQLFLHFRADIFHRIPGRMTQGLEVNMKTLDLQMAELAKKLRISYFSPMDHLCNQDGCMTRLGETGDSLVSFDYGHFTEIGSRFVASKLHDEVLNRYGNPPVLP